MASTRRSKRRQRLIRQLIFIAVLPLLLPPAAATAQDVDEPDSGNQVLVRVNGGQRIGAEETISVAVIVNGDVEVEGRVENVLVVVDGDATLLSGSEVSGTIVMIDGTLTLRDGSVATGNIYLSDDARWVLEEGAVQTGEVRQGELGFEYSRGTAWRIILIMLVGWLGATLILLIASIVFAGVGGRQLSASASNLTARPGATLLTVLVFWTGLALLAIPLTLSGVGILALPVLLILAIVTWFLGLVVFATRIGALVAGRAIDDRGGARPYAAAIAGALILQLLHLIAVGGLLATVLAALLSDNTRRIGLVFGMPALFVFVLLWAIGMLGGGALALQAFTAWTKSEEPAVSA